MRLAVVLHSLLVFFARHWLLGFVNGVVTAALCLGMLALARLIWPTLFSVAFWLRLRHLACALALYKSALYLVLGDSRIHGPTWHMMLGYQTPGPSYILAGLVPQKSLSIWHPTPLTHTITGTLVVYALLCLLWRGLCVVQASRTVDQIARLSSGRHAARITRAIAAAAEAIDKPNLRSTPFCAVEAFPLPTPFVIGLRTPKIVISNEVLAQLDEPSLQLALRHELMHISRRDHIWRWILLWLQDIGAVALIGPLLLHWTIAAEERLCDLGSIRQSGDATRLATAITLAIRSGGTGSEQLPLGMAAVSPGLRGLAAISAFENNSVVWRMHELKRDAQRNRRLLPRLYVHRLAVLAVIPRFGAQVVLLIALVLVIYTKYFFLYNVN